MNSNLAATCIVIALVILLGIAGNEKFSNAQPAPQTKLKPKPECGHPPPVPSMRFVPESSVGFKYKGV